MESYIKEYDQGAYLIIIKSSSGEIYGLSCEFEVYTRDFDKAAVQKNEVFDSNNIKFDEANWIAFDPKIGTTPASWDDITNKGLSNYIIGYQLESEVSIHRFE